MDSSGVEVLEISAQDSTLIIDSGILTLAVDKKLDGDISMNWSVPLDHSLYRVLAKNEVVILGCEIDVIVEWDSPGGGEPTSMSCILVCMPGHPAIETDGICSGTSCCSTYNVEFLYSNMFLIKYSVKKENLPLNSSVALVEKKWWSEKKNVMVLQEAVSSHTSLGDSNGVLHTIPGAPIRTAVSWVFSSLSCAEASNSSDFGCRSDNSECLDYPPDDPATGGYSCQCLHGYEGNPYERHGCQGMLLDSLYSQ
jgi:hypothetical protein